MMRRVAMAVLALVSLLGLSAVVAEAGPTKSVSYTLTGSSEWNALEFPSSFAIAGEVSDGKANVGTYTGTLSAGTFAACADNPYGPACAPVTGGTITFALRGGSITTAVEPGGTVWQVVPVPSQEVYVFELTLSVTSGTHAYAHAQGTLSLVYQTRRDNLAPDPVTLAPCFHVDIGSCPISDTGTLTGTITR
jgi:hypothetical protein